MSGCKKLIVTVVAVHVALLGAWGCSATMSQLPASESAAVSEQAAARSSDEASQPAARSDNGFPMSDMSGYAAFEGYASRLVFYDLTVKDIKQLMDDGASFAFVAAFSGCPWCNLCIAQLNDAALAEGVQVGYLNTRLDPDWGSNTDIDDYDMFVELFGDYLSEDDAGVPHLYTPHVFVIRDGAVVAEHAGGLEDADDPSRPLSEEQAQRLVDLYREELARLGQAYS